MPYVKLYSYFAKCRVPWQEARVSVYFDDYTPDYGFTCSVNGVGFALVFNRLRAMEQWEWEKFAPSRRPGRLQLPASFCPSTRWWRPSAALTTPGCSTMTSSLRHPGGQDRPRSLRWHAWRLTLGQGRGPGRRGRPDAALKEIQAAQRYFQTGPGDEAAGGPAAQRYLHEIPGHAWP